MTPPAETGTPNNRMLTVLEVSIAYFGGVLKLENYETHQHWKTLTQEVNKLLERNRSLETALSASRAEVERVKRHVALRDSIIKAHEQTVAQLRAELSAARACIQSVDEIAKADLTEEELPMALSTWRADYAPAIASAKEPK